MIGELIMEGLKGLDDVAYVRFASVYRNFREAKDFGELIDELSSDDTPPRVPPRRNPTDS
jgi:transcriptional repressor NrdR